MYIKVNNDKSLVTTIPTTIFRGEKNADLITFLIPSEYEGKNMADCAMLMRYVTPNDAGRSEALAYQPEMYKDYLQYSTVVNTRLTEIEGDVTVWLTAMDSNDAVVWKTGEVLVHINASKDLADYLPDEDLDQLDRLEAQVQELQKSKADNIIFHAEDSTIQLLADGVAIGDRITVSATAEAGGVAVSDVLMNDQDELVIRFTDGTEKNLGKTISSGGQVYVPHVDEHKILTFTIEDKAGEIPDPVDLNPNDEWSGIDDSQLASDYIWEDM